MPRRSETDFSIRWTRFCMSLVGFWKPGNQREERIFALLRAYTISIVGYGFLTMFTDLYFCRSNFSAVVNNLCASGPISIIVFKILVCLIRRDTLHRIITFSEDNFWNVSYDDFEEGVMKQCEKKSTILIGFLSCAVVGSSILDISLAVFASIGKSGSDRSLPFGVNITSRETPYYEISFTFASLCTIHCGFCYFCFDVFLILMNIYTVGQFKILQYRFETAFEEYVIDSIINSESVPNYPEIGKKLDESEKIHAKLKECIKQHALLVNYVEELEYLFNIILLGQMGISSILLCLTGFQALVRKQRDFLVHVTAGFSQLLLFTWTCNELIVHSLEVGEAAYRAKWYVLPETEAGRSIRTGLMMVVMRSQKACCLTAGKFAPVSLRSFTAILSTTVSYLSLLRRIEELTE